MRGRAMQAEVLTGAEEDGRFDARALNWRFIAPPEPAGMLLLPVEAERVESAAIPDPSAPSLEDALRGRTYPAVVVGDVGRWARIGRSSASLFLYLAAEAVAPGGWLYAGFSNPLYPLRRRGGGIRAKSAARIVSAAGMVESTLYLALPDHRRPAYIVPRAGRRELEFILRRLFVPFDGTGSSAGLTHSLLPFARRVALIAPQGIRASFAPSFALVARRPG